MKKGFTLVEMLAVILILGVILLIGVPIYQGVQKSTNESIYESKIANVKSKAEKYSAESGEFIYDINYMIREGLLTPDNESGEYRDPRNGRNMQCDIVRVELENDSLYATIEETESCYNIEDLQKMSSVIKIVFYKESTGDETYDNGWIRANTVYAGYTVPEGVTVTNATWSGGWNVVNNRLEITASEILNVPITLNVEFIYNEQKYSQNVSRNVMIDLQSPISTIKTGPGSEKKATLEYVEWRLSDGDGSGVAGHILLDETLYNAKKCESYSPEEIMDNDKTNVGYHLKNGIYYMCVKDNVGNITKNSDAEANKVHVTNVDQSSGDIESFNVVSKHPLYKTMDVKLEIDLKDNNTNGYQMCLSHIGYLQECSWEEYRASKEYTITNYEYGEEVPFFLSIKDEAGNISNIDAYYTTDKKQILDLNGKLNDTIQDNIIGIGKCDIYINGELAAANTDYHYKEYPPGTTYEIKNIKSVNNNKYKYVNSEGSLTGTIGKSRTNVRLNYVELYTISYDTNGGTGSIPNQTKEYGKNIKLSSSGMTRNNYTLAGWNLNATGTGTNYNLGGDFNRNANTKLYAVWSPNIMTVSLDNQSAKTAGTTKVYYRYTINKYYSNSTATTEIATITKPTKDGYTFDGYYTAANGGGTQHINASGSFVNNLYNVVGNTTLYAKWKANTINITLDRQSGSGGSSNIFYAYNTNAYYSNNTLATSLSGKITVPTRTGYTFKGYYSGPNGTGKQYVDASGKIVNDLYKAYSANTTIYANWTINSYVVTWNANGGSCNKTSQSVNYGAQIGTLPTCSRSNHTFQGWYTATSGGSNIATTTTVTQAVTYYARWKENNYTITFNANGGTASQATRTINAGSALGTLPTATKASIPAAFTGWYTAQTGGSKISSSTKPSGNTTYYAHWSNDLVIPFDVTFNWDNVRGYKNLYAKVTMAFKNNQVGKGVRYHQYTESTGSFQNANGNYNRPGKYSTNSYSYWLNYSEGSGILTTNPSGQNTQDGGYLYNWAPLVVKGTYNSKTRFYDWSGPWSATKYWINQQVNSGSTLDMLETLMSPSAVYVVSNERSGYDQYNVGIRGYVIKVADYAKVDYTCTMSGSGPYHFRFQGTITLGNYALSMPTDSTIRGQTNPNNYPGESININSYYPTSLAFRFMEGDIVSVPISIN